MTAIFIPIFLIVQTIHRIALWLDGILYPGFKEVEIEKPVFIVGIPRSGTTHLHKVLSRDEDQFTTTSLWELIFAPSIIERKIILAVVNSDAHNGRFLHRAFEWVEKRAFKSMDDIHKIDLTLPEEDYFFLLPEMACFLLVHPFPFDEMWKLARFDESASRAAKKRIMAHYKSCLQRHLYFHGGKKTILSKNPAFSGFVQSLQATFPDCRIVGCIRTPVSSVPSLVSSMMEGVEMFDNDPRETEYRDRFMDMLQFFYRHLHQHVTTMEEHRHQIVKMKDLKADLIGFVSDLYERFGIEMTDKYRTALEDEWNTAKAYKSGHKHSLDQFDLTEEYVEEYFAEAFDLWKFPRPSKAK